MFEMRLEIDLGWFGAKLTPLLYTSWHFFVKYFENFRHWFPPAGVASASELLSWIANWSYQKKMDILRVVDRSVTLWEEPWRERFEKYWKSWNFRDFWWSLTNSGGGRSGCGLEIWTYILFGSISMSETQNFKNIGWSHGLQGRKSESTTPHLRGCVLELACRRSDRPGRSRNLGNRKSARMQQRRAFKCDTFSFFLVASIGDATTMRSTPKSPWNREFEPLKLVQTYVNWHLLVAKNVSNALRNGFGMICGEAHAVTLHVVTFFR